MSSDIRETIYASLLKALCEGRYQPGDRLPTEQELAATFKTNRMTARQAMTALEAEGLIDRRKREGTFVRKSLSPDALPTLKCRASDRVRIIAESYGAMGAHWDPSTLEELEQALAEGGLKAVIDEGPKTVKAFRGTIASILAIGSRALIILPGPGQPELVLEHPEILASYSGDIFYLNRGCDRLGRFPYHVVSFDPYGEGVICGRFLSAKYPESPFFFLSGPNAPVWAEERLAGLLSVIPTVTRLDRPFDGALTAIGSGQERPAVLIGENDATATTAIDALKQRDRLAPRDYRVIGFDNHPCFRHYNLTTVAPPIRKLGKTLAKLVLDPDLKRNRGARLAVTLDSTVIERETA